MTGGATARGEVCSEKLRLASDYGVHAARYSDAVKSLQQRMGVLSKAGYDDLLRDTEKTRELAENARLALNRHVQEHEC